MGHCRKTAAVAAYVLISFTAPLFSEENKELNDDAYCMGVLRREIALTKEAGPTSDIKGKEQLFARKFAIVAGAEQQKKIEVDAINAFLAIGDQDAQLCSDITNTCATEGVKRAARGMKTDTNVKILNICVAWMDAICKKTKACTE